MVQGELFRQEDVLHLPKEQRGSFFSRHRITVRLDFLMVSVLVLGVSFILFYCFGVEQGKRSAEERLKTLMPTHGQTLGESGSASKNKIQSEAAEIVLAVPEDSIPAEVVAVETKIEIVSRPETTSATVDASRSSDFTVQLVTYNNRAQALGEVKRLENKGYSAFVIPSGRYFQVCANYFPSRSKARPILRQFRGSGRYPDAYIRPVVR